MDGVHILRFTTDLSKTTKMQLLKNPLHEGESKAHTFVAKAVRDGAAVDLTGLPVTAYYNFNNETMPLSECEIVNGEAKVTLSEACYIPCVFDLLVMVGSGDERSCILWVHGAVRDSMNDTVYDPESVVPNLPELIALIETIKTYDDVKLDANLGAAHAGDILYVSGDGSVQPLTLGALAAALESFHGSGSSGDNVTVPSYWQSHLDARAVDIRDAMGKAGWAKSAFLFYSDAHWTYNNKQSPALLKWLYKHTPINKVAFGGDIIDNEGEVASSLDYLWEWRSALRGLEHHSVPGNHDDGNDPDNRWTDADVYTFLLAPEETPYVMRGGALYYYIDEPAEKTRYLYLDTATKDGNILNDPEQEAWLKETLLSTPDGWHIVAIAHIWRIYDSSYNDAGFSGGAKICLDMFDAYNDRADDFADCGGKVEFCIGGHTHKDADHVSAGGIPVILVQCDSSIVRSGETCTPGTITENCVSAIVADYLNGTISVIRIGRGSSRVVQLDGSGSEDVPSDPEEPDTPDEPEEEPDYNMVAPTGDFTNMIDSAIDTDGSIYNGNNGYLNDARYSTTSQSVVAAPGWDLTGYIPAKTGDTLRFHGLEFMDLEDTDATKRNTILMFDANFVCVGNSDNWTPTNQPSVAWSPEYGEDGDLIKLTIPTTYSSSTAYIRVCAKNITGASIITVNEEIVISEGVATMSVDADGNATIAGVSFEVDEDGNATIGGDLGIN